MRQLFAILIGVAIGLGSNIEYTVDYDRLEIAYIDKTLFDDGYFLFRKYNKTNYCLNISFNLLEDLDGRHIVSTNGAYQLFSNQYKFTGIEQSFNVCKHVEGNVFGIKDQLAKYGNLVACDIKKGFYYMYNYMPDIDVFPKYVPPGSYMLQIDVKKDTGKPILTIQWYVTATLKLPDYFGRRKTTKKSKTRK